MKYDKKAIRAAQRKALAMLTGISDAVANEKALFINQGGNMKALRRAMFICQLKKGRVRWFKN
jgi:hypothetical protein